jgi:hypothetical protein
MKNNVLCVMVLELPSGVVKQKRREREEFVRGDERLLCQERPTMPWLASKWPVDLRTVTEVRASSEIEWLL